jgi:energy-coupling factor transport system substrate-specific component
VIGGILNSCITWILFGFNFATDTTALFAIPLHTVVGLPKFAAEMVAAICMDIADKFLAILAVFFILRSMPSRFLVKLKLGNVYIPEEN